MRDLVWKDVVAARRLLWLVFLLGAVQIAVMAFTPPIYVVAVALFCALLAFGSILIEEYEQTEPLWNSLPVSRSEVVTARYTTALIGIVVGLAFSWALAQSVVRMASSATDGPAALLSFEAHTILFGFLVFGAAVYLPLYFRFGAGRSVLYFSGIAIAMLIAVSISVQLILKATGYPSPTTDPQAFQPLMTRTLEWVDPRFALLLTLFVAAAASALGASLLLSRRFYETRDL